MSRLRWLTAGESHGPALVATLEGLPAGVPVTTELVADQLARRRLGYGRGARMKFERDEVTFLGGVRHGLSMGSPIAIMVGNTEWPKWEQVMSADPVDPEVLADLARNAPLTRPRPGHADLRVGDVLATEVDSLGSAVAERLRARGWRRCGGDGDDADAQPRYVFQVPLAGRSPEQLWSGLNQEWRRNVRTAKKAGVEIVTAGAADLPEFYRLLRITEERDGFRLGRSLAYYERQYAALNAEQPGRMRLYLAVHGGEVLAAHTMITVGRRVWYQTGASADHRREVRPSNALQWQMMLDAHALGAEVYDMRGVPSTLDPQDRPFGLLRWKLGTGGQVVETLGEWETPMSGTTNHALYRAFQAYLARR
ncbi:chorismate synthase [Streptomyces sp. ERV7]|uniref:chorismate synthase n=1 Tax=Streptomyces sp. ERV7 TaxID=1322334 RepID=UPI0009A02522|nr:chorismate synthase [Streptomyces sp. ERV7]